MKTRRLLTLFLAILLTSTASCGGSAASTDTTAADTAGGDTTAAEGGYDYAGKDFGGFEFRVLNYDERWNCNMSLDFESQTGETLNDAIYERNRYVEEMLNFKLVEVFPSGTGDGVICDDLTTAVAAGDDVYDAAYQPISDRPPVVTDGYLHDLTEISTIKLEEEYWDNTLNDLMTIGGHLYTASSPMHLMTFDLSWVVLFNEDMFTDLKLEFPYQLVRDGKWTLDKMNEYVTATVRLNGDESFTFNDAGSCVYGIAAHNGAPLAFNFAADNRLVVAEDDSFKVTFDTERTFDTMEKMIKLMRPSAGHANINNTSGPGFYIDVFRARRAAFLTCEVKATLEERDMEDSFGMIPFPKFDESQKNYYTNTTYRASWLTFPKTLKDPERAGVIVDALSYESFNDILPLYYDVTVSQKGLRNDDSIEMLDIIRASRGIEFSVCFGPCKNFYNQLSSIVKSENNTLASYAASEKTAVEQSIKDLVEAVG